MGAETGTTLTLVWIHKLVYCVSAYHDQPRPPRRLALTVETKRRQIKGACSKVYFMRLNHMMRKWRNTISGMRSEKWPKVWFAVNFYFDDEFLYHTLVIILKVLPLMSKLFAINFLKV